MAVEDVIPSVRRGKKLIDTVMAVKDADGNPRFSNMDEFQRFLQRSGMPMIGQTGGEASLELLNSMVEPKDRYIKISPDYQKMEEATLKTKDARIKKVEGPKTAEKILTISAEAESKFPGKMTSAKKSFIERALKQANIFIDDAAKLGFKSLLGASGPIGATIAATIELATASKADAKELIERKSMEDEIRARLQEQGFGQTGPSLLTQMKNDPENIGMANGGVASIFNMTRPLSFAAGGPTPPELDSPTSTYDEFGFPKTGQETGETIGQVKMRPKKPNEVDRQQIYEDVMSFTNGEISADEFLNRTGFYLPLINGVRGGGNFRQVFNTLMIDLDKRGYTGLAGTSLLPVKVDDKE